MEAARLQYQWVRGSRAVLLRFCGEMSSETLCNPVPGFGRGSIRNTLVHIANTYYHWLGVTAMDLPAEYYVPEEISDISRLQEVFSDINGLMERFFTCFSGRQTITIEGTGHSPLQLFTHTITHEFHHKGQIMSMGRLLGHMPPDADIIREEP